MGSILFMRKDKLLAIKLRKGGKSYNQINSLLNIPKSTLSAWLKNIELSSTAKEKIQSRVRATSLAKLIRRNKDQTKIADEKHRKIRELARQEATRMLKIPLFIVGTSLYWAEGYKKGADGSRWKGIDFANSDPKMIKIMISFFEKFLRIKRDKIKIQIMVHSQKQIKEAGEFWHNTTRIPKENIIKTYYNISKTSLQKRENKLKYGTIHLRVSNTDLFFRLIGWIDKLKENF